MPRKQSHWFTRLATGAVAALAVSAGSSAHAALVWYSPLDGDGSATVGSDPTSTTGAPTATADRNGNAAGAVLFDGNDNYIIAPEAASFSAGTLSVWVRNDLAAGGEVGPLAVGGSGGGQTEYFTLLRTGFGGGNDSYRTDVDDGDDGISRQDAAAGGVSQGAWHHLAATFDAGGTLRLYIDGVQVDTQSLAGGEATIDPQNDWVVGAERTTERFWNGAIDDAAVYTHALTNEQIYNLSAGIATPDNVEVPAFSGIAKDSFQTTEDGAGGTYDDGANLLGDADNMMVTAGTVGFAPNSWAGGGTTNMQPDNDGPANGGLNHHLIADEIDGALQIKAKDPRTGERQVAAAIPASESYFMSLLVHASKVEDTNVMSLGFGDSDSNRDVGFHVGFNGGQIAAFAGGTTFDLIEYALNETYLVVLQLDVDAAGDESLSAWVGAEFDGMLTRILADVSVETFASTADISWLQLLIDGSGVNTDDRLWWFDEVRLATSVEGLGVFADGLSIPTPGALPAGLALLGLTAVRRRRSASLTASRA